MSSFPANNSGHLFATAVAASSLRGTAPAGIPNTAVACYGELLAQNFQDLARGKCLTISFLFSPHSRSSSHPLFLFFLFLPPVDLGLAEFALPLVTGPVQSFPLSEETDMSA